MRLPSPDSAKTGRTCAPSPVHASHTPPSVIPAPHFSHSCVGRNPDDLQRPYAPRCRDGPPEPLCAAAGRLTPAEPCLLAGSCLRRNDGRGRGSGSAQGRRARLDAGHGEMPATSVGSCLRRNDGRGAQADRARGRRARLGTGAARYLWRARVPACAGMTEGGRVPIGAGAVTLWAGVGDGWHAARDA